MEMWVLNDGFLQRLAQLSQEGGMFEQETIGSIRSLLKKQKAKDLMNGAFLDSLAFGMFTSFDPRGDETLPALQTRYAEQFIPHDIPDQGDLSPVVTILRQEMGSGRGKKPGHDLLSSVLAAMVYVKFQRTDLRDRDAVAMLGSDIRRFVTHQMGLLELCGQELSGKDLRNAFEF